MLFMQLTGRFCRLISKKIAIMSCAVPVLCDSPRAVGSTRAIFEERTRNLVAFAVLNDLGKLPREWSRLRMECPLSV